MSTTENPQPENKYTVRILWGVPADSHEEAVTKTLDQLSRFGIMDWVYQSRSPDGDIAYLNGDLERIDIEGMARAREREEEESA